MTEKPTETIGWIGTGIMGRSLCAHLLRADYKVNVYNRTKDSCKELFGLGAQWQENPRRVADSSQIVFVMVGYPRDVREVILGAQGVLAGSPPPAVVVDMTTSQPGLSQVIARAAAEKGIAALDAPVSGGDLGAREGTLSIMVGGDAGAFERVLPLFRLMGKNIVRHGGPGAGQHAKAVNQTLIASTMLGICEALLYAQAAGLDLEKVLTSVAAGAAGSWSLQNYAPRILRGDFEPGFMIEHFVKDLEIVTTEARRMNLPLPGIALAEQLYISAKAKGLGKKGTQALLLALADLSTSRWSST
jgi:3-hydroxyisobutyrate dehydrogenase